MVVLFKFNDIVGSAADNHAKLFQRDHCDILALFQRVERFVVDTALQQLVLRYFPFFHRLPHRTVVENRAHPPKDFSQQLYSLLQKTNIVGIITIYWLGGDHDLLFIGKYATVLLRTQKATERNTVMFRYLNHRFHWNNFSFQIPDGFYLDSEPGEESDNFLWLWFPNGKYALTLHVLNDCSDTKSELESVIADMTPEWSSPIEPITVNGFHGHHAAYHQCHPHYYEVWLQIADSAAFNIVMENPNGVLDADTAAVIAAIDPRLDQES